jgi:two-component system response regulator MprA
MDSGSAGTSARILLIEDEPAVARMTELVLVNAGHAVVLATEYAAAQQLLDGDGFALVIADTELGPRTTGLSALVPLVKAAHCPVVLCSAHRFTHQEVAAAGLAGAIQKPFDIDDLLQIVEAAIEGGSPAQDDGGRPSVR